VIYDDGTNVGIGTTDPGSYKLNVAGTAAFNSVGVTIDGSSYVNAQRFVDIDSNYYLDPANITIGGLFAGNVGIGTTSPANKLDVAGTAEMTGFKMTTSPSSGYVLTSDGSGVGSWTDVSSTAGPWSRCG
jgi:hypothetical protein